MAFYVDFSDGGADFPEWSATGDFTIAFRYVFGSENNDIILGESDNTRDFIGKLGSVFSVKLANTKTDTNITITSGLEVAGTITRVSGAVTVSVNGQTFNFTKTGTVSFNSIGYNQSVAPTNGSFYYVALDNGVDAREYESDGVGLPDNEPTGPQDATLIGNYSFVEYSGGNSISITEADRDNFVFQRNSQDEAALSLEVTYGGTPTSLEYRLLDARDDSTEVQGWQVFDSAPSGGASTLTFNAQAGLTPVHIEVRHGNDNAVAYIQTNAWWVGDNILLFGQSLANYFGGSFSIGTPPEGYFQFDGTDSVIPTSGAGALALAQEIIDSSGCAVCILNAAVSGSSLMGMWLNENASTYQNMINEVNAMTGGSNVLAFAWWHQGTADSKSAVDSATYQGGLNTLFSRVRAIVSGYNGSLDLLLAQFGRYVSNEDCTDESHQAIRKAQVDYIASDVNCHGINFYPRELSDGVHGTKEAYQYLAGEIAVVYYGVRGEVALQPLKVTGASYSNATGIIYIDYNRALNTLDSSYSLEGVRVTDNGSEVSISGFTRVSSTRAEIQFTGSLSGTVELQTSYGRGSTTNELTYPRTESATLPSGNSFNVTSFAETGAGVVVSSLVTLNIGAPDGAYKTYLIDQLDNVAYNSSVNFSNGSATISGLPVPAGTALEGYVIDNESPHVNGAVISGVTV